jgi:hypothetical protein
MSTIDTKKIRNATVYMDGKPIIEIQENDQETLKKMKVKRRNKVTPEELRNLEAERDRTIERLIGDSEKAYKIT